MELRAEDCERARQNRDIYNISSARYCREVCQYNRDGACHWER